jgi:quercetin dioxygenase-like cupin family protein
MVKTSGRLVARLAALALTCGVPAAAPAAQQQAGKESALHHTATDPKLSWGGCPEFMPKGCAIAVLHGDPAQPNADVFFKVPAGAEIPRHHHTSAERMVLVSGEMKVTYDGQAPVTLRPGSYAYGPAKAPHSATCAAGAAPCVLFIAFEGPVDALAGAPAAK